MNSINCWPFFTPTWKIHMLRTAVQQVKSNKAPTAEEIRKMRGRRIIGELLGC